MSWTQEVMEKGKTTYESILEHPFIQEMAAGTLAEERFALAAQFLTSLQYEYDFWSYEYYGE